MCRKFWWLYRLYYLCQKVSLISRYVTQRLRYILSIFMDKPSIDFFQNAWILKAHESLLLFVKCFIQWNKETNNFFSKIYISFVCLKRSNIKIMLWYSNQNCVKMKTTLVEFSEVESNTLVIKSAYPDHL